MSYRRPPLKVFIDTVKRYDKRVGLRKLYKDYEVPTERRQNFRDMWDKIADEVNFAKETKKPKKKKAKKKKALKS